MFCSKRHWKKFLMAYILNEMKKGRVFFLKISENVCEGAIFPDVDYAQFEPKSLDEERYQKCLQFIFLFYKSLRFFKLLYVFYQNHLNRNILLFEVAL